jgi:FHS family L-fucose permease-like MFS transporter
MLVPFFKSGFNLSYSESSLVQFYFFLTYGIMSIHAGVIVARTGYKKGMVLGFSIAAIGAFFLPCICLSPVCLRLAKLPGRA